MSNHESGSELTADLVLEGGGVKGLGLVGAVAALQEAGYRVHRVAGTSTGAIVGSLVAAGLAGDRLRETALSLDYRKFRDPAPYARLPLLGPATAVLYTRGLYRGDYAHAWLTEQLADLGVRTFADLALRDPRLPPEQRYKLTVIAADVTRGELVRLPWDYRRVYGLDPDEQPVADAVRASMSIPFFFEPVTLAGSTLVDGGLLSNFPIDTFDRTDGRTPRWPTFGIKLLSDPEMDGRHLLSPPHLPTAPPLRLLEQIVTTTLVGHDRARASLPWVSARTIQVDTEDVGVVDFDLNREQQRLLYDKGHSAAWSFLKRWDWRDYLKEFRVRSPVVVWETEGAPRR